MPHLDGAFTVSRVGFVRSLGIAAAVAAFSPARDAALAAAALAQPDSDDAWGRLVAGNKRYASDKGVNCGDNFDRRLALVAGQRPFAVVLACADSRVAPELVFDQRVGDIFVVRVAGNIADTASLGSIEYAVSHFAPRLLVVMGHEKCGAVEAAVAAIEGKAHLTGHVAEIVGQIEPAARTAMTQPGDLLNNAIAANIRLVVAKLRASAPVIQPAVAAGNLRVIGVRYGLGSGIVSTVST